MEYENLEDARQAAMELMSGGNNAETSAETAETPASGNVTNEEQQPDTSAADALRQADTAVNAAEDAANALADTSRQLDEMRRENENLKNAISQMNSIQEDKIEKLTAPILDIDGMAFDDEETKRGKLEQYANDMLAYSRQNIMGELQPMIDEIKNDKTQRLKSNIINELAQTPEFGDINENIGRIEAIIGQNPNLFNENVPTDEQYVIAAMLLRGLDSKPQAVHEPTTDELMSYYKNNEDFKKAVEQERIAQLNGQQVPPLSPGTGTGSAALNIDKKPETLEEATDLWRKLLNSR